MREQMRTSRPTSRATVTLHRRLRGTVYVIVNGVPVDRHVLEMAAVNKFSFTQAAATRVLAGGGAPAGASVEFGPIGPCWSGIRA